VVECWFVCSAAEAADGSRRLGPDGQLCTTDVELRQRWPRPVLRRSVPTQVLGRRSVWRDIRRGHDRVHGPWSEADNTVLGLRPSTRSLVWDGQHGPWSQTEYTVLGLTEIDNTVLGLPETDNTVLGLRPSTRSLVWLRRTTRSLVLDRVHGPWSDWDRQHGPWS